LVVSVVYGIDRAIRGVLARRPVRYALTHPVMLVSMAFPPVRLIFSFRLVRSVFRRGHLGRFLVAAPEHLSETRAATRPDPPGDRRPAALAGEAG
jgi:hypothetical protein